VKDAVLYLLGFEEIKKRRKERRYQHYRESNRCSSANLRDDDQNLVGVVARGEPRA
jgi:hypothetical protein